MSKWKFLIVSKICNSLHQNYSFAEEIRLQCESRRLYVEHRFHRIIRPSVLQFIHHKYLGMPYKRTNSKIAIMSYLKCVRSTYVDFRWSFLLMSTKQITKNNNCNIPSNAFFPINSCQCANVDLSTIFVKASAVVQRNTMCYHIYQPLSFLCFRRRHTHTHTLLPMRHSLFYFLILFIISGFQSFSI